MGTQTRTRTREGLTNFFVCIYKMGYLSFKVQDNLQLYKKQTHKYIWDS